MGLKDLRFTKAVISTPGGDLAVRGLSLVDVTYLVGRHKTAMAALFDQLTGSGDISPASAGAVLLERAPDIAAEIVVLAAGESPDDADALHVARTLPFPTQLEVLEAIGTLTFQTEGSVKKLVETVIRVSKGFSGAISSLQT